MAVRLLLVTALLITAPPALILSSSAAVAEENTTQCTQDPAKKARHSMFGSILGSIAGNVADRAGVGSVAGVGLPVNSLLSDAITKLLDCGEQQKAAAATNEAMRGGVGAQATWQSDSRPNVHGSSTVTGQEAMADGSQCLTVTDVVIVDGNETTVPKKMCRAPGASGYVRV